MGFSYGDWAGAFYPSGMKAGDYLGQYARHFDAVKWDTNFTRRRAERFGRWARATPAGLRFAVKTPRAVTHDGLPQPVQGDAGTADSPSGDARRIVWEGAGESGGSLRYAAA